MLTIQSDNGKQGYKVGGKKYGRPKIVPFPAALAADMAAIGFGDTRNPQLAACRIYSLILSSRTSLAYQNVIVKLNFVTDSTTPESSQLVFGAAAGDGSTFGALATSDPTSFASLATGSDGEFAFGKKTGLIFMCITVVNNMSYK